MTLVSQKAVDTLRYDTWKLSWLVRDTYISREEEIRLTISDRVALAPQTKHGGGCEPFINLQTNKWQVLSFSRFREIKQEPNLQKRVRDSYRGSTAVLQGVRQKQFDLKTNFCEEMKIKYALSKLTLTPKFTLRS